MPHIHCYLANAALIWTMASTDSLIGIAYVGISITIFAIVKRTKIPFSAVIVYFGIFIGACGLTHLMDVWTLWKPDYWWSAATKVITAIASVGTGIYLFRLRHTIITVAEAAKLSEQKRQNLETLTAQLEQRVKEQNAVALASEKRLLMIKDKVPSLISYIDFERRYQEVNKLQESWLGKKREEIIGKYVWELLGREEHESLKIYIDKALAGEEVHFCQKIVNKFIGERIVEALYIPDISSTGIVKGFVAVINDRTDSAHYQQELQRHAAETEHARAQLEAVFQFANEGISVFDMNGQVVMFNEAFTRITEFRNHDRWKKDLRYFGQVFELINLAGEPLALSEWPISRILRGETVHEFELRGRNKDTGKEWYFSFSGAPVRDEHGKQSLAVVITRDITEQKIATQALAAREEQFRTYTEAMPQMAFIADGEGRINYYNQRFYDYVGVKEKLLGWDWKTAEIHHPDDLQHTLETWSESVQTGKYYQIEYRLRRHDGTYRWHLGRATPVRNEKGKIVKWIGTNTDIHDQKENALALERALRSRDDFLSIASHELKTPLAALKLQTQIYQRKIKKGDPQAYTQERINAFLEQTDRHMIRLTQLVEDMLDIARIRSGNLMIHPEPFVLSALVRDIIDRFQPMMSGAGSPVTFVCDERIEARLDKIRVEQVVTNLLTNAMRYGGQKPVTVKLERAGTKVRLSVQDKGVGVPEAAKERIFDRFERAISASEVSGLGLGLFITKQIVEAHGGHVWVKSPGKGMGATFIVELPLQAVFTLREARVS